MSDLISRQDAIDACRSVADDDNKPTYEQIGAEYCLDLIKEIPSAEPERKKGKFLGTEYDGYSDGEPVFYEWKCSECGCIFEEDEPTYNFCPNCGADMRVSDER